MAGQLKIGGNVIAAHAGTEGAGTVTLDSSTLTIGSNTTVQGQVQHSALPSGSLLQIATGFSNSAIEMSAATGVRNIGVSASITPKSSGSTVLVYASMQCSSSASTGMGLTIKRTGPSDQLLQKGTGASSMDAGKIAFFTYSNWSAMLFPLAGMFTDTTQDATTSHVYNIQLDTNNSVGVMINRRWNDTIWMGTTQIVVMEIKA